MIDVKMIAHSVSPDGNEIVSFIATYPRSVHSEALRHRMFSRNAASSRAIPIAKFRDLVTRNPVIPTHFGKNKRGMSADEMLADDDCRRVTEAWLEGLTNALRTHEQLESLKLHKQDTNRVLEPWMHMSEIITATELDNFWLQRSHEKAHPFMQDLSDAILYMVLNSEPTRKELGEWHLPFGDKHIGPDVTLEQQIQISTARCARLSYANYEGVIDPESDFRLYADLLNDYHMSPFEHPCECMKGSGFYANFRGWRSHRYTIVGENRTMTRDERLALLKKRAETSKYAQGFLDTLKS